MTTEFNDEPGFPYLAFCPISVYDPSNHDPVNCPYCGRDNLLTDEEINNIITGGPGRIVDDGFCTCGGSYDHMHTDQYDSANGAITEASYYCANCKTWAVITFDAYGVETERRYEAGK